MRQPIAVAFVLLSLALAARAQTTTFTYQGQLLVSGSPHTGSAELRFTVWDAASAGSQLAATSPTDTAVNVTNGLFAASLDFGAAVFTGADRWLDIQVRTGLGAFTPLTTRQRLTATPYAIRAREAAAVPPGSITAAMIANNAVGDAQISTIATPGTVANSATSADSVNTSNAIVARDGSGRFAAGGVTIAGGTTPNAFHVTGTRDGFFATPLGLIENFNATGSSGPALRLVTYGGDSVDGVFSVSSTGEGFLATFGNAFAFVSRLTTNGTWRARAYEATDYLQAGFNHDRTGIYSSVTGGANNTNRANYSFIGGGWGNSANAGSGEVTLAGGSNNSIGTNSSSATISGGGNNRIADNSFAATVPGGWDNEVAGNYSFAAGVGARALHNQAFVWSDGSGGPFLSTAIRQFSVRAAGGARFVTGGAGMTLDGLPVVAGLVGDSSLANDSVSTLKIVDGSVGTQDLANGAVNFDKLLNNSVSSAKIIDGSVQAVDVDAVSFNTTFWRTGGNASTTAGTHYIGTSDNQPLEFKVNGVRALRLESQTSQSPNFIAGSPANVVSNGFFGAVIGGGGDTASPHRVGNSFATVVGGNANTASGDTATAMGLGTTASGTASTAVGLSTLASGVSSTAMGSSTIASGLAATTMGADNEASGSAATAMGGGTAASGSASTAMGLITIASGNSSTAMGSSTIASGDSSTAMGSVTIASGNYATAMGRSTRATNTYTFAAGFRAQAGHLGAFVWADSQNADFPSTFTNQFRVRASGGMDVVGGTNTTEVFKFSGARSGDIFSPLALGENRNTTGNSAPALRLVNHGGNSVNGVLSVSSLGIGNLASFGNASSFVSTLTTNGTWSALAFNPTSDRNAKENFTAVDPRDVLAKVAVLPLARWNYKAAPGLDHIGPVAQDFHAAFGLNGADDKHIATVDADGVALAAIQGLNQKLEEREALLRQENVELKARLERLEQLLK